ncbi:hypothetical protein [Azospirillum sp. TSO35-2]|uniref:hypothetical protein n=1 Tax=Azospirillum sp. TSO35-2 TaxID=716796 RepID=UPI0018EE4EB3|nr:hypothetical protein [Azospirillum sp. TSO35-2]
MALQIDQRGCGHGDTGGDGRRHRKRCGRTQASSRHTPPAGQTTPRSMALIHARAARRPVADRSLKEYQP